MPGVKMDIFIALNNSDASSIRPALISSKTKMIPY